MAKPLPRRYSCPVVFAQAHTQALTSVGTGAAKAAGGAVKYTAKGIWNVGKYATR